MPTEYLTPEQAAEYLGISIDQIRRAYNDPSDDRLPAFRLSHRIVKIRKRDLEAWVERHRKAAV
jgi:excisionase family DNA binding protein